MRMTRERKNARTKVGFWSWSELFETRASPPCPPKNTLSPSVQISSVLSMRFIYLSFRWDYRDEMKHVTLTVNASERKLTVWYSVRTESFLQIELERLLQKKQGRKHERFYEHQFTKDPDSISSFLRLTIADCKCGTVAWRICLNSAER